MTPAKDRRNAAPDPAAIVSESRPARDGAGYSARPRPATGDPLAWFGDARRPDRRDDDENDDDFEESER